MGNSMTNIAEIMDTGLLQEMLESAMIRQFNHDTGDLYGLNYTPPAQFSQTWNAATLNSRGLIVRTDGLILARPFKKFFNHTEGAKLPARYDTLPCVAREKFDGSLGIRYVWEGQQYLATRGSFSSDQAQHGTEQLRKLHPNLDTPQNTTDLFEIVYPDNRIVVDYGATDTLFHLARLDNATNGRVECDISDTPPLFTCTLQTVYNQTKELLGLNAEGVVCEWADGHRVKVKLDEYVELHRVVFDLTNRRLWQALAAGMTRSEILSPLPDEFHGWAGRTIDDIEDRRDLIRSELAYRFSEATEKTEDRKGFAQMAKQTEHPSIMFSMLDGNYDKEQEQLWRAVEPKKLEKGYRS